MKSQDIWQPWSQSDSFGNLYLILLITIFIHFSFLVFHHFVAAILHSNKPYLQYLKLYWCFSKSMKNMQHNFDIKFNNNIQTFKNIPPKSATWK